MAVRYYQARLNILAMSSPRKAAEEALELFSRPRRKSRKNRPPVFDGAENLRIDLDGQNIHGYRWNHPQPEKVLIVHGFESNSCNFRDYVYPLIRLGYEVLAFDAPGHGRSSGKKITLPQYIKTIQRIDILFGPINHFVGHSFGGLAIMHFLEKRSHDERTKVVLLAPATEMTRAVDMFFEQMGLREGIRREFDALVREKTGVGSEHFSIRRALSHIRATVLWIHDRDDRIAPWADAKSVQSEFPERAKWLVTDGLGHRRIYKDPTIRDRVVDFLRGTTR